MFVSTVNVLMAKVEVRLLLHINLYSGKMNYYYYHNNIQVAALAPLALLLVLEARCAHFVIAHFNNMSSGSKCGIT